MNVITKHQQRDLIANLLEAPTRILEWQDALFMFDADLQARATDLTLDALSKPLFPGKKDGDPMRPATNDDERKLAVQMMLAGDEEYQRVLAIREDAARHLAYERNKLEAAKVIARLLGENGQS